jgi:hypothetical protein
MIRIMVSVYASFAFLVVNVLILLAILALNRRAGPSSTPRDEPDQPTDEGERLPACDILGWEFEYARVTASEAMGERHTMVNFYLLVAGVVASGVVAILARDTRLPATAGTVLLWSLCGMGWLYFLGIIRLRQAWHDSARVMNRIKEFYIQHAQEFGSDELREAFRWQAHTLPAPDKPWTVYFYSAMLISLLNSMAYVGGGALFHYQATGAFSLLVLGPLGVFGLAFFAFHVWLYFAFLKQG